MGMTATQLGSIFGLGAAAMNVLLRDHGYLDGGPGAWQPTELGKQFSQSHDFDNGYGGYAHRSWGWLTWSDDLIEALKASIEANPNGIVPDVPTTVVKTAGASTTSATGHTLGKNAWAMMAVVGAIAVAVPVAKKVWDHSTQRRQAEAIAKADEHVATEEAAVADPAVDAVSDEDAAVEDNEL